MNHYDHMNIYIYIYIFFLVFLEKYAQWSNAYRVLEEKNEKRESGKKAVVSLSSCTM